MAPLTTGAPPVTAHAIHAQADTHAAKHKSAKHAAPKKSKSPKLHPRRSTTVAKKVVRTASSYRVQPGDSLTAIAARQGVSLTALIKANHVADPNRVLSGSTLQIPHATATHRSTPSHSPTPKRATRHATKHTHRATPKKTGKKAPSRAARHTSSAVSKTRAALARRAVPSRTQTKALIERTAKRYGVSPRLALGISWQESGWNQRMVSPVNAVGTMQVMPQSGEWASALVGRQLDLLDTQDNVTAGVAILRYLTSNSTDLNQAIGAYYQGLGAMQEHGPYSETKHYVRNVKALMHRL